MSDQPRSLDQNQADNPLDSLPNHQQEQEVQEVAGRFAQLSGGKISPQEASELLHRAMGLAVTQTFSQSHSGPLPPPELMRGYEDVLTGSAERIMGMAERQAAHRQELEKSQISTQVKVLSLREEKLWGNARLGIWLAFIICLVVVVVGAWLVYTGNTVGGGLALGLSSLAAAFIYGSQGKQVQGAEDQATSET